MRWNAAWCPLGYKWEDLQKDINQTAEIVLGRIISKNSHSIQNNEIEQLLTLQKETRLKISNSNDAEIISKLRKERKLIQKEVSRILKVERETHLEAIIERVESANNDSKMFKAVKELKQKKI